MRTLRSPQAVGLVALLAVGFAACDNSNQALSPTSPGPLSITCTAVPASGLAPLRVAFAVVTNAGPPIEINYGDGTTGSDPLAGHTYANPGSYRFTMTAQAASCNGTVSVSPAPPGPENQRPVFRFHVFPKPPTGAVPLDVEFSGCQSTDPDGDPVHFNYDFGDGSQATGGCRRTHTYVKRGTFTAQICGSDGQPDHLGCAFFTVTTF